MGFADAVRAFFSNYTNFSGRSSRSEYWWPQLAMLLAYIPIIIIGSFLGETAASILLILFALVIIIPSIALAVRRLHDTDKSGWFLLISLIPLVSLILLVFYCTKGTAGPNRFGPDPLGGDTSVFN